MVHEAEAGPSSSGTRSLRSADSFVAASRPSTRSRGPVDPSQKKTEIELPDPGRESQDRRASTRSSISSASSSTVPPARSAVSADSMNAESSKAAQQTYSRRNTATRLPSPRPTLLQPLLSRPSFSPERDAPVDDHNSQSSSPLSSATRSSTTSPVKIVFPSLIQPTASQIRKGKGRAKPPPHPSLASSRAESARPARPPRSGGNGPTGKPAEKRVLPARIRRAAGGGAEGIRDLEEMILDWLERWGEPSESPPDSLILHLTTLPLSLVNPPPSVASGADVPADLASEPVTITPNAQQPSAALAPAQVVLEQHGRIEVPSWIFVKAGEDDKEEARDEIQLLGVVAGRRVGASPMKRSRHAAAETHAEDTSDTYYTALHKKYEVIERRQRIREKETLQFERYKMRSRIDLLRGMSKTAWAAVLGVVLSRAGPPTSGTAQSADGGAGADGWAKGREKLAKEGVDWLRETLVKEGEALMRRYDQLLPPEHKKPRITDSRTTTPMISPSPAPSPSLSPPPVIPHRVAILRDAIATSRKRAASPASTPATKISRIKLTFRSAPAPGRSSGRDLASKMEDDGSTPTRGRPPRQKTLQDGGLIDSAGKLSRVTIPDPERRTRSQGSGTSTAPAPPETGQRRASLRLRGQPEIAEQVSPVKGRKSLSPVKVNSMMDLDLKESVAHPATTERRASRSATRKSRIKDGIPAGPLHTVVLDDLAQLNGKSVTQYQMETDISSDEAREMREVEAAVL